MLNTILSRMPRGPRFTVGVGLALVPILLSCYGLRAHEWSVFAWYALVGTAAAEALLLIALGWVVLKFRRDLVSPFVQATQAIRAIASGDLTKEVPAPVAHGEIRDMFDAIKALKENSVERSRLETERDRLMEELALMANTDSLTRLLNRRAFEKRARALCAQAQASHIALIMFDIDHFKRINDTYGHAVGDDALRLVAQRCRRNFAQWEIVARIGGEEFAVMTSVHTPHQICSTAERMREDIATAAVETDSGTHCHMTASFGIAFAAPTDVPDVAQLLRRADRMLYEAKMAGRNRVMADFGVLPRVPLRDPTAERPMLHR